MPKTKSIPLDMLKHVTLYASKNVLISSLGLQDIFVFASQLQEKHFGSGFNIDLTSIDGEPITCFGGLSISPKKPITEINETDLVLILGVWGDIESSISSQQSFYKKLIDWHKRGVPILALATGSYFLAEAGLLNGRMCTTHWHKQGDFAKRYPQINVRPDRYITATSDLYCCAGINAAMEIIVYLLSRLTSSEIGLVIESTFLVDFRRGYTGEFAYIGHQTTHNDDAIHNIQQWIEINFARKLTVEDLAQRACMSTRTFKRRFKNATSESPINYIQKIRIEQGRELLKYSDETIAQIAWKVGYSDAEHFNRLFKRHYKEKPSIWRKRVRKT